MKEAYRSDIDGLRAVAVLAVVLYHAGVPGITGGFVGVDVFFVISGFLITRILAREMAEERLSIAAFYERRARRILPAFVVMLAVTLAAGWALLLPDALRELAQSGIAATLFVSNIWFWWTLGYFSPAAELNPMLHTWSLAVEEQFYIVFPLLLMLLRRRSRGALVAVIAAATAVSFALSVVAVVRWPEAAFYLAPGRAWELGVGALLALVPPRAARAPLLREAAAATGLAAIVASVVLLDSATPFPGPAAAPAVLGTAAVIWAGGAGPTRAGRLLGVRPVVFVGLISYSLYLWHWPILALLRARLGAVELEPATAALAVVAAFAAAALSTRFVERRFRAPSRPGDRRRVLGRAALSMGVATAACAGLVLANGVRWRFEPDVLAAYDAAQETPAQRSDRQLCNERLPEEGLCRLGSGPATPQGGPLDFLLWGDSHAIAAAPAADIAAVESGRRGALAVKTSCPPLLGVERVDQGAGHDCADFNDAVLAFLRARRDIPLVVLVARWALNAEGVRPEGEGGGPALLGAPGAEASEGPEANFAVYRAAVDRTIAAIRATGREVVVFGEVPEMPWDVATVYPLELAAETPDLAAPTRAAVEARQGRSDAALAEAAARDGARFVSIAALTCPRVCQVAENGRPLYRDNHHLSWFGAVHVLKPLFDRELARPLAWPQRGA